MPNDERQCAECGAATTGPFCGNCGTRTAAAVGQGDLAHDEPTRMRADALDDGPYRGYARDEDEDRFGAQPVAAGSGGEGTRPNRANQVLVSLIVIVALAVTAMLAYLLARRGSGSDAPVGSGGSTSRGSVTSGGSSPTSSSSSSKGSSQGSSSTGKSNKSSSSSSQGGSDSSSSNDGGGGNSGGGTAPAPSSASESSTSAPNSSTTGIGDLPGLVTTTSSGGSDYGLTRSGNSVTVWQSGSSGASQIGSFTLYGGGGSNGLEFLNLPGCSKPVVAWNAAGPSGSAAYGFDGSGYQAYVGSSGGGMSPSGGTGTPPRAYGVNGYNGMLEVRDSVDRKTRGQGNMFDSCTSSSPDVLHMVGS